MALSPAQKKHYRTLGHKLKPVVTLADKGLSDGVTAELARALADHELVKVKIATADRDNRKALILAMCEQNRAELVQEIGKVVLLFKASKKEKLPKSNIR